MRKSIIVLLLSGVFAAGCTTINYADTRVLKTGNVKDDFYLTTGDAPKPYRPLGLLEVSHTGVVVLGMIPISPGYLVDVKKEFVSQAEKYGANAAINVRFETWRPPFPLCVLWWVSWSTVRGEVVYIRDLADKIPAGRVEVAPVDKQPAEGKE